MPVEILIDDKHFSQLGPEEEGLEIPNFVSIHWTGDNDPEGGTLRVTNLKTKAYGEGDIPEDAGRVFLIKVGYINTPFCKGPIFYKHEILVKKMQTT